MKCEQIVVYAKVFGAIALNINIQNMIKIVRFYL